MPDKVRKLIYEMQYNFVFLHLVKIRTDMKPIDIQSIGRFVQLTGTACRPVIVTHAKPDGDAIGSCTAMYRFLTASGTCNAKIILNDGYPSYLDFLTEGIDDIIIYDKAPHEATTCIKASDLIICMDFNAFHRTGGLEGLLASSKAPKILIDHHLDPDTSLYTVAFSETQISSASELLYYVLKAAQAENGKTTASDKETALALMTGMTTDTNNLNNSVYPSTLMMASELLSQGVDRDLILQKINLEHSESRLRLKGHMLKDLLTITEDGVAFMILDRKTQREYNMKEGDTEGFVNEPLSIAKVRMSIFAREELKEIRISIRSKKGTSANRCARLFFNGGGHENAAGGKLNIPIGEVEEYIRKHTHIYMSEYEEN